METILIALAIFLVLFSVGYLLFMIIGWFIKKDKKKSVWEDLDEKIEENKRK